MGGERELKTAPNDKNCLNGGGAFAELYWEWRGEPVFRQIGRDGKSET